MHSYQPDSSTVRDSCLRDVDTCDLYVLILGYRYGFQPDADNPDGWSITHLEFRRARDWHIPRIALLRNSVPDIGLSDLLDPQKTSMVRAFHDEVRRSVRAAEFTDLAGLIAALSAGVNRELEKLRGEARQTTIATDESRYFSAVETLIRQLDKKDAENTALRQTVAKLESELRAALPPPPVRTQSMEAPTPTVFEPAKNEAAVVGSSLVVFVAGVSAGHREAILNSLLLAQLVASRRVQDDTRVHDWYEEYLNVFSNLGWNWRERSLMTLEVAPARFQIGLAEQSETADLTVDLNAFAFCSDVTLDHYWTRASINTTILDAVREMIAAKLGNRTGEYVRKLPSF